MKIEYRQAIIEDAELLVNIYNASFYDDYLRYGSCPGYGQSKETMEESIGKYTKHIILYDNEPVGCVSCINQGAGVYEVGCLCVIPEYQGKGIGTQAIRFVKSIYEDWVRLTLVTPIDKKENVKFYTEEKTNSSLAVETMKMMSLGLMSQCYLHRYFDYFNSTDWQMW